MVTKFSIIIPAYNASKFIKKTLDSVKAQIYKNYEVIIVNDGSNDDTEEIVKKYVDDNPAMSIYYIYQENAGVSAARYRCGLEAKGDYLAFLDADDIWKKDKLLKVHQAIIDTNADIIYHDFIEISISGRKRKECSRDLDTADPLLDLIMNGNAFATSATCLRTNLYKKVDPFSDKKSACEDYECWIKCAKAGGSFYHLNEYLSEYKRNKNSLTLVNDKYIRDSYENKLTFYKYLDRSNYSAEEIKEIRKKIIINSEFALAREYHKQGQFLEAIKLYKKVLHGGNINYKSIAVYILALIRINR